MTGTYAAEKRDSFRDTVVYGLVHPLESSNPIYAQVKNHNFGYP